MTGLIRGKVNPKIAMFGHKLPKADLNQLKNLYKKVEDRNERVELNLYVTGYEDEPEPGTSGVGERQPPDEPSEPSARSGESQPADKSPTFPGPGEESNSSSSESESA
jgi:hypothetical protein